MIRLGIVGSNYGRLVQLPAFRADPRCQVVALAGSDAGRTEQVAREAVGTRKPIGHNGPPVYQRYAEPGLGGPVTDIDALGRSSASRPPNGGGRAALIRSAKASAGVAAS